MARKQGKSFTEMCVIYESEEDKGWVAHGLRTDQIGCGDCVVDALVAYVRAVDNLLKVAGEEKDVQILREAPPEVQARQRTATPLPKEIYEIAHKRVRGTWPKGLPVEVSPSSSNAVFKRRMREPIPS
jgi:hypothetical protein